MTARMADGTKDLRLPRNLVSSPPGWPVRYRPRHV